MRNATLLFLIKKNGEREVSDICLAMKKRGFGVGRWNGAGGKVEQGETIKDAAQRETREEIGVTPREMEKVAELTFYFANKPEWDQMVHVYLSTRWEGEAMESEEMKPEWFAVKDIPFPSMWPDDIFWLPQVLKGEHVRAAFTFGEGDAILDQKVEVLANKELFA